MENMPAHPTVFITPEGLKYKPPKNWKPVVLILLAVLIIGSLSFAGFYYRTQIQKSLSKVSNKLEIISMGKISDLTTKNFPTLFYADLEYDPKTGVVTQLKIGKKREAMPIYSPDMPQIPVTMFAYRVSVVSAKGELIQNGWILDNLNLTIRTVYDPKALVRVYTKDNKLIWIGKII